MGDSPQARLSRALVRMRGGLDKRESSRWHLGQLYNQMVREQLHLKAGLRYPRELCAAQGVSQSTLSLYASAARAWSEPMALKYGVTLLAKLNAYLKASHTPVTDADPGAIPVIVPLPDGATVEKPFADCTWGELTRATRRYRPPPLPLPPSDAALVDRLQAALRQVLGADTRATVVAVHRGGTTRFTFQGIPLNECHAVGTALKAAMVAPDRAAPRIVR